MTADYLALPGEEQESEKTEGAPPALSKVALDVARERTQEREAFVRAWRKLTSRQQVYLRALQETGFSQQRALKLLAEAIKLEPNEGRRRGSERASQQAVARWARENPHYKIALAALRADTAARVAIRDELIMRAHRVAEYAEEEHPILHQGEDTGFRERALGEMLRANEQLMKATKVLGGDDNRVQVAVGPALIVQVVQGDGSVKDVTPRGVTIDLPQPPA